MLKRPETKVAEPCWRWLRSWSAWNAAFLLVWSATSGTRLLVSTWALFPRPGGLGWKVSARVLLALVRTLRSGTLLAPVAGYSIQLVLYSLQVVDQLFKDWATVAQTKFAHGHLPKDFCSIKQENCSKRQMPKRNLPILLDSTANSSKFQFKFWILWFLKAIVKCKSFFRKQNSKLIFE